MLLGGEDDEPIMFATVYCCRNGWLLSRYCDSGRALARGFETWQLEMDFDAQGFRRCRKRWLQLLDSAKASELKVLFRLSSQILNCALDREVIGCLEEERRWRCGEGGAAVEARLLLPCRWRLFLSDVLRFYRPVSLDGLAQRNQRWTGMS